MIYAQKLALEQDMSLHVCFALPEKFREATIRQYGFMLRGLQDVEKVYFTAWYFLVIHIVMVMLVGDSTVAQWQTAFSLLNSKYIPSSIKLACIAYRISNRNHREKVT